jgi:4-amino-4-deoxy-L-arabinose transferase-like glycosyltransferase
MSAAAVTVSPDGRAGALVRRASESWHVVAVGAVLALSAVLNLYRLSQNGWANTYYSAAVRSMLGSWRNFFFVSFDPGGLVSVDKPPLALWVQAASAKLFGFSTLSLLVPEALAGVAAVGLLYLLVARVFGRLAGVVAALALALSPVSVSVSRDNNPDALLALLLVAAAYVGLRSVESGRLRTLLLTAALVGLAFNTKMLAAAVVVPALAVAHLVFAPGGLGRKLRHGALATAVLVAVSGAWIAAVELTPAVDRPYVGSTTDNSALSLALGYNGLGRVTGQEGGTSVGGGLGGAFSGTPGLGRLLNDALGDQGGWLLALAVVGGVSALLAAVLGRRRRELAALTVVGGWFVTAAAIFSFSSGIIHTYYLSALAPALAGLVGIGAASLWRDARRGSAWVVLPLAAIALSAWIEIDLLQRSAYLAWLRWVVVLSALAAFAVVASLAVRDAFDDRMRSLVAAGAVALAIGGLLVAPAAWSATTWRSAVNGVFPGAGPSFVTGLSTGSASAIGRFGGPPGGGGFGGAPPAGGPFAGGGDSGIGSALSYVHAHGATSRFALVVSSEQEAATYVVRGEPVASLGGFTGRETVLTPTYLARLVRDGDARYFLLGGGRGFGPGGGNNTAATTIESTCTPVPSSSWSSGSSSATLYDCAGKADAIAASGS